MTKDEIIKKFNLRPHVEGGYFTEVCTSPIKYNDKQTLYSSILFLLGENDISHMHRLEEDELWYFQYGDDCTIIDIDENFNIKEVNLGMNKDNSVIQYLVKKGHIFGSKYVGKNFTLVGCMVSPSFTYDHFELIKHKDMEGKISQDYLEKIKEMFVK